ncbi:hypothetical protein QBC32DRAFT_361603 [Pseudoneurospora amorphoporcata]|uniref:Uncharacterized protein n=1 Tax=Pseudoneurospora amorphoporcata TaxID=241081 RepID=A0AAN6NVC0_9PEZI|nr:hypothetical protein QBC32DRAFT_361603 [Pseudoneurospora amorphoporcata]
MFGKSRISGLPPRQRQALAKPVIPILAFMFLYTPFYALGWGSLAYTYMSDLFPYHQRSQSIAVEHKASHKSNQTQNRTLEELAFMSESDAVWDRVRERMDAMMAIQLHELGPIREEDEPVERADASR